MVNKKINIRNSGSSLTGLVMSLLLVMGIFFGAYNYLAEHATSSDVVIDDRYEGIYNNLSDAGNDLDTNVKAIESNVDDIKEAESTFQVAWNGLKGLGNTLKLPISFIGTTLTVWTSTVAFIDFLPGWVIPLVFIGIIAFVVFLILKVLKGEPAV